MKTTVKEHPILFGAEWVRLILAGRKTQTRRPIFRDDSAFHLPIRHRREWRDNGVLLRCPFGKPGDRLWVRETWARAYLTEREEAEAFATGEGYPIFYRADWADPRVQPGIGENWRPSIHMPRWASRITLEVVAIQAQRLRDMTVADVVAEGIDTAQSYLLAWERTYGHKPEWTWDENPWVWACTFRRIEE